MHLIIPMAGRGKRLRPQSNVTPKPLLSVCGQSMVERIVAGFERMLPRPVTDCVFILGPSFERDAQPLLTDICARYKVRPHFVVQHKPLGTAHAVSVAADYLSGEGIVVYADTVFDMGTPVDLSDTDVMVWVKHVEDASRFGVAVREADRVVRFVEKPREPISNEALIGIYYVRDLGLLHNSIQHLFAQGVCGVGGEYYLTDAFDHMLGSGLVFRTTSVRHWLDCGTLAAFMDTVRHLLDADAGAPAPVAVERCVVVPPVYLAPGARAEDSVIGPYVCLEKNATATRSVVRNSILFEGAAVSDAVLDMSFVGAHSTLRMPSNSVNVGDFSEIR